MGSSSAYTLRFYSTLPDTMQNNLRVQLGLLPEDRVIAVRGCSTLAQCTHWHTCTACTSCTTCSSSVQQVALATAGPKRAAAGNSGLSA